MGYRRIDANTKLAIGKTFTDKLGNNKVTIRSLFTTKNGVQYVAYEDRYGYATAVLESVFLVDRYEETVHDYKTGDIFIFETSKGKGAYFLVTDDKGDDTTQVIRFGMDEGGEYYSHTSTGMIKGYVDVLGSGNYGWTRRIRNLDSYGLKLAKDNS